MPRQTDRRFSNMHAHYLHPRGPRVTLNVRGKNLEARVFYYMNAPGATQQIALKLCEETNANSFQEIVTITVSVDSCNNICKDEIVLIDDRDVYNSLIENKYICATHRKVGKYNVVRPSGALSDLIASQR